MSHRSSVFIPSLTPPLSLDIQDVKERVLTYTVSLLFLHSRAPHSEFIAAILPSLLCKGTLINPRVEVSGHPTSSGFLLNGTREHFRPLGPLLFIKGFSVDMVINLSQGITGQFEMKCDALWVIPGTRVG